MVELGAMSLAVPQEVTGELRGAVLGHVYQDYNGGWIGRSHAVVTSAGAVEARSHQLDRLGPTETPTWFVTDGNAVRCHETPSGCVEPNTALFD